LSLSLKQSSGSRPFKRIEHSTLRVHPLNEPKNDDEKRPADKWSCLRISWDMSCQLVMCMEVLWIENSLGGSTARPERTCVVSPKDLEFVPSSSGLNGCWYSEATVSIFC
jgi:hypothetical protein